MMILEQLRLVQDDILVSEGGSIDQVGRAALWGGEIDDCVHQNHILRVRVDPSVVLPMYLVSVLNSGYGQRIISDSELNAPPIWRRLTEVIWLGFHCHCPR